VFLLYPHKLRRGEERRREERRGEEKRGKERRGEERSEAMPSFMPIRRGNFLT
jgi:hypothetical protein